ncbi:TetR/AcrR family transcriptional regulator [Streptomyces albiaxialis]|uniref:TetR/AcrR family transcriptional regulator n=1 Tax=Streptomyces albiaxialis TaxID=329523 RepID=A0ABN2WTB3_9ACTN
MSEETMGRRERKKAQTRQALADAALRLFLERGYENVGVRDVAEAADVAVTTLFKHFPSKEALVFDEDEGQEEALVSSVRDRAPGQSVLGALRDHIVSTRGTFPHEEPGFVAMLDLVRSTPALRDYMHRMWMRHEEALAAALTEAFGVPEGDVRVAALAHYVMEIPRLAHDREDPPEAMNAVFDMLERGWGGLEP